MHVDRAGPEVVAARHCHPGVPDSAEQRPEHGDGGPHALDQLVGRLGPALGAADDEELVGRRPAHFDAHVDQQLGHAVYVGDAGHVGQPVLPLGKEGGGHQLEG